MPDNEPRLNRQGPNHQATATRQVNFHDTNNEADLGFEDRSEIDFDADEDNTALVGSINYNNSRGSKSTPISCFDCGGTHRLVICKMFLIKSVTQRLQLAKNRNLCTKCLASREHSHEQCQRQRECTIDGCRSYHHWLLHSSAHG